MDRTNPRALHVRYENLNEFLKPLRPSDRSYADGCGIGVVRTMCSTCTELKKKIERYRTIIALDIDAQTTLSMKILIEELEAEQRASHGLTREITAPFRCS